MRINKLNQGFTKMIVPQTKRQISELYNKKRVP